MCHLTPFPHVLKRTTVVFWLHDDVISVCLNLNWLSVCTPVGLLQAANRRLTDSCMTHSVASIATNSSYRRLLYPIEIEMP